MLATVQAIAVQTLRGTTDEDVIDAFEVYRPRFVRHRIGSYAACAMDESWLCRTAAGVRNPCRSMSQVVL
jgi:hypothetical protein